MRIYSCVSDADKGRCSSVIGCVGGSIVCRDPSVLVWSPGVGDKTEFISWDLVHREFLVCCDSVQCCQPRDQSSFSSCCPNHMIQGFQNFEGCSGRGEDFA